MVNVRVDAEAKLGPGLEASPKRTACFQSYEGCRDGSNIEPDVRGQFQKEGGARTKPVRCPEEKMIFLHGRESSAEKFLARMSG